VDASGRRTGGTLAALILIGCAVSLALGITAKAHDPSGRALFTFGDWDFPMTKSVLASVAMVLGLVQVTTAFAMYRGHPRVAVLHRASGVTAVLVSIPVALGCVWSLGFGDYNTRVLVHSVAGCVFYGVFVAKMLSLRSGSVPSWTVPVLGITLFLTLVVIWGTAAAWYLAN